MRLALAAKNQARKSILLMREPSGSETPSTTTGASDPTGEEETGSGKQTREPTGDSGGETDLPGEASRDSSSSGTPTSDSG